MPDVDRVTLFIDYQNVYATARAQFHADSDPPQDGHVWPVALGELIVGRRPRPSVLHEVRIYRGLPDPERQLTLAAVNDRQAVAWEGDRRAVISGGRSGIRRIGQRRSRRRRASTWRSPSTWSV